MIKDLSFEQEKKLANNLYYGGGYTKKYLGGGETDIPLTPEQIAEADAVKAEKKENTSNQLGAGLAIGSSAIDALDTDDKYGGADVASSTLKYASMGAAAGPWGAAAGAVVGLGVGLVQKSKFEKQEEKGRRDKGQKDSKASFMKGQEEFAGYQEGGTIKPNKQMEYEQDPAYRKIKAKYEAEAAFMRKIQGDDFKDDFFNQFNSTYSDNTKVSLPSKDRLEMFRTNVERDYENTPLEDRKTYMNTYKTGGMTKGAYSHSSNPLTVVDKSGKPTGMELTGGEGVFDKPFMGKVKNLLAGGKYQEAGKAVQNEMTTWKHK
tara:strand:- start:578 stop:1534 length:957 start_codon:yes stop_codon:yes gene_type:complete